MGQLCWKCANFSSCPWSYGIPVEGWVAEKTKISYSIRKCPLFVNDTKNLKRITIKGISKLINKSERTVYRYMKKGKLKIMLKDIGYDFLVKDNEHTKTFYIRKLRS